MSNCSGFRRDVETFHLGVCVIKSVVGHDSRNNAVNECREEAAIPFSVFVREVGEFLVEVLKGEVPAEGIGVPLDEIEELRNVRLTVLDCDVWGTHTTIFAPVLCEM